MRSSRTRIPRLVHSLSFLSIELAEARAGIAKVAGVERESLDRTRSTKANPRLSTLTAGMKAFGLKLSVEAA